MIGAWLNPDCGLLGDWRPVDAKRGRSICSKETTTRYLAKLVEDGRIERFDTAILKPQTIELGGFILIQGSQPQIDTLRRDEDFEVWVNQVQLVSLIGS